MTKLANLKPYTISEPPILPGWSGKKAIQGFLGRLSFIVTVDDDDHIEVSLSVDGPLKPTDAQVKAFFKKWGEQPIAEHRARFTRHFTMLPFEQDYLQ
ncbi:hypothetical protein [uncultured Ruegeria sp.]|uniref:hypothetical protein n=1 Tax=uncultured Ruegeria sp. TaxID=259304 RepID=UPI0026183F65|nr:hypothetical protein [uncultured Ruegeria sp.]